MPTRLAARACLLSLALLSCQSAPDISGEIEYFGDVYNISVGLLCECHEELGYAASPECEDAIGSVDIDERECMASALEGREEGAKDYLGCVNDALDVYRACLEGNAGCAEGWNADCTSDYESARGGCTGLGSAQVGGFQACIP